MKQKNIMRDFIKQINNRGLMTSFIKNIFDYESFYDYNYLFRMIDTDEEIIIDIYDNVSNNRFNRYIFSFNKSDDIKIMKKGSIFVNYISVQKVVDSDHKLMKLAYLFKIEDNMMIDYASSFLDPIFIDILEEILK